MEPSNLKSSRAAIQRGGRRKGWVAVFVVGAVLFTCQFNPCFGSLDRSLGRSLPRRALTRCSFFPPGEKKTPTNTKEIGFKKKGTFSLKRRWADVCKVQNIEPAVCTGSHAILLHLKVLSPVFSGANAPVSRPTASSREATAPLGPIYNG